MSKQFFDEARKIAGGSLSQTQVDELNKVVNFIQPNHSQKVSTAGINLICSFEGLRLNACDDGVGVWTISFGTTFIPMASKSNVVIRAQLNKPKHLWYMT